MSTSYSQIKQDLYVLEYLGNKRLGYFVELGASDGIKCSNTYLLEKEYDWTGILIEPTEEYNKLVKNRKSLTFKECVSDCVKKVKFISGTTNDDWGYTDFSHYQLSGIKDNFETDITMNNRICRRRSCVGSEIEMITTTLDTVLDKAKAPKIIDYLSLDIEGEEYNVLKNFPFDRYQFRIITVEHNYIEPTRSLIYKLLINNGYVLRTSLEIDDVYTLRT